DARRRSESRPRRLAQGARAGRQAGVERRAADPRRAGGAPRSRVPAVGRLGEDARRRAVEAVRGSAPAGERGTNHQADARLRPRLIGETRPKRRAGRLLTWPRSLSQGVPRTPRGGGCRRGWPRSGRPYGAAARLAAPAVPPSWPGGAVSRLSRRAVPPSWRAARSFDRSPAEEPRSPAEDPLSSHTP